SMGPDLASLAPWAVPAARRRRVAPRRNSSAQDTPLPHSGCAWTTWASTRRFPAIGLRQPTAACSFGEGCTATPCGFILPGMRTCWPEELATRFGVSLLPQPLIKSYPDAFLMVLVK